MCQAPLFLPRPIAGNMTDPRKLRLRLAYDGTRYHGWQSQKNGITIQEVLEEKLGILTQEPIRVIGSGRTDAGVHALGQACHFETCSRLHPEAVRKGLNSLLPDDVLVRGAREVPSGFHARYDARSKVYEYRMLNRDEPDVFLRRHTWHVARPMDLDAVRRCLSLLRGEHDFTSFRSTGSGNRNPVRHMLRAEMHGTGDGVLRLVFEANGFLRHMVRNLVGTLVDAGAGKTSVEGFSRILEARDRREAGPKAPPQGLFLVSVRYDMDEPD